MKRVLIFLMLTMSLAINAQTIPSFKNIKLTQIPTGSKNDSIVVLGNDKTLKFVPQSAMSGKNLQQLLFEDDVLSGSPIATGLTVLGNNTQTALSGVGDSGIGVLGKSNSGVAGSFSIGPGNFANIAEFKKDQTTLANITSDGKLHATGFFKSGGNGTNVLLDDGSTTPLSSISSVPTIAQVLARGGYGFDTLSLTPYSGAPSGVQLYTNGSLGSYSQGGLTGIGVVGPDTKVGLRIRNAGDLGTTYLYGSPLPIYGQNQVYLPNTSGTLALMSDIPAAPSQVDTAFKNVTFSSTINKTYNKAEPNFKVDVTGNSTINLTGTVNGDSGLVNLYFSGAQSVTLSGTQPISLVGTGAMLPIYFIHDTDGLKWYKDEVGTSGGSGGTVDTSDLVKREGSQMFYTQANGYTGTMTNVGVNCTVDWMPVSQVGNLVVKANGEKAIVATVPTSTTFTTVEPFATNSTSAITGKNNAINISTNGDISIKNKNGDNLASHIGGEFKFGGHYTELANGHVVTDGYWKNNQMVIDGYDNRIHVPSYAYFSSGPGEITDTKLQRSDVGVWQASDGSNNLGKFKSKNLITTLTTYANDAAADADATLLSGEFYKLTGSRVVYQKP